MGQPQIDGYLKNKVDCWIVGSGPSLKGFNFDKLLNKFTIALNHTIEFFPLANCLLFGDKAFLQHTTFDIIKFPGLIFASKKIEHQPPLYKIKDRDTVYIFEDRREGVSHSFDQGLYHPTSAGALALNLALIMKARNIYLLGFDYKHNGSMHFYPDKPHHATYGEDRTIRKIEKFFKFVPHCSNIYNLSPDTNLKCFFPCDLGAVL
jgi:hypothetical protein